LVAVDHGGSTPANTRTCNEPPRNRTLPRRRSGVVASLEVVYEFFAGERRGVVT